MAELHRIIVGIDFGTTYSAAAWAETSNPAQVELIKNWPTSGQLVGAQAPSEIAYLDGDTNSFSWGYDISPRERKLKWFKLGLESDNDVLTLPLGMTAVDVVRDYLSGLYKHVMTTLYRRFDRSVMQMTKVDFILTVPAIWSDAAKKKPESAAIYTFKSVDNSQSQIRVGNRIVVCDAGGGTVDLISYEIRQTSPNLAVIECAAGTGDFAGSTFIDRNFEKLFAHRMGTHHDRLSIVHRLQVVKNFEFTKIAFRDDPAQQTFYVNVPTIGDLNDAGVYGGNFELTREEMRSLFDPVVDQIIDLISVQIVSAGPQQVNSILLVGGFGESEYLYKRVTTWASQYNVQVIQPREASTAIVRGAVLKGLEPRSGPTKTEVVRRARRSYGVPTNQPYIEGKHAELDLYVDRVTGDRLARNQISWFVRKNQAISDDEVFRHAFFRHFKTIEPWSDSLVSCTSEIPPSRWDDSIQKHCTITSDLTHLSQKANFDRKWRRFRPFYTANYDLVMGLKSNNLNIKLEFKGRTYGVADVKFE